MSESLREPPFEDNPAPDNNFWSFSWFEWLRDVWQRVNEKVSIVGDVIEDHFPSFNADGDLIDSGKIKPDGEVVGTTDTQLLTNKSADYLNLLNDATDNAHALRYGQALGLFLQDDVPLSDAGTEPTLNTLYSGLNPYEVVITEADGRLGTTTDVTSYVDFTGYATQDYVGERFITENLLPEPELDFRYSAFGDIHVHDAVVAQTIATGATYVKLTAYTDNGISLNCTPDVDNDQIIFDDIGCFFINVSMNGYSNTANVTFKFTVFLDGVEQDQIHCERKFAVANDFGSASMSGFVLVESRGAILDVRARHDFGGDVDFTVTYSNLSILYAGCGLG